MPLAAVVASEDSSQRDPSDKRPGAFRTISEVAEELDVPQHVLRFWESRFAQIKPLKRAGGRRYYRPDDIDLLRGIRRLLHKQGYTIRGAQLVLKEKGSRFVQAIGRGEAQVDDAAAEHEADGGAETAPSLALGASDRADLHAVLSDLRACRAMLVGLQSDFSGVP